METHLVCVVYVYNTQFYLFNVCRYGTFIQHLSNADGNRGGFFWRSLHQAEHQVSPHPPPPPSSSALRPVEEFTVLELNGPNEAF